jgi:hypothetical protein
MIKYNRWINSSTIKDNTFESNKFLYKGSGTCIIEHNYNNQFNNIIEDTIFLFYNSNTTYFELPYGSKEVYDKSAKDTAYRETREETANLFDIRGALDTKNCMISHGGKQQIFVVRLLAPDGGIQSKIYYNNLNKIKKNHAPYSWYELNGITRVSVNDFIKRIMITPNIDMLRMKDIYGNNIIICKRDTLLLYLIIQKKLHLNTKPIKCIYASYHGRKPFLKGTYSYKV